MFIKARDLDKIGIKVKYVLIPRFRAGKGMLSDCSSIYSLIFGRGFMGSDVNLPNYCIVHFLINNIIFKGFKPFLA